MASGVVDSDLSPTPVVFAVVGKGEKIRGIGNSLVRYAGIQTPSATESQLNGSFESPMCRPRRALLPASEPGTVITPAYGLCTSGGVQFAASLLSFTGATFQRPEVPLPHTKRKPFRRTAVKREGVRALHGSRNLLHPEDSGLIGQHRERKVVCAVRNLVRIFSSSSCRLLPL